MAQSSINSPPARSYVGIEATYGTTPSMTGFYPITDSVDLSALQKVQLPNMDQKARAFDRPLTVFGLQSPSPVKFKTYGRANGTQLGASVAPVQDWLWLLMRLAWGNDDGSSSSNPNYAPADAATSTGSTTTGSPTTTSLPLTSAADFKVGDVVGVDVAGTLEPGVIKSISANTLTLKWPLSAAPASGQNVRLCYTIAPSQNAISSGAIQHAIAGSDTALQWVANACRCDFGLSMELGKLIELDWTATAASWTGPSNQSLTTTTGTDTMSAPISMASFFLLLQNSTPGTRTQYALQSAAFSFKNNILHVPGMGGDIQGTLGVQRVHSPDEAFCTANVKFRTDETWDSTQWTAQTNVQLFLCAFRGSGTSRQWFGIELPTAEIVGKPKTTRDGHRVITEMSLESRQDNQTSGATTDLALAPVRIFWGP